ncbi:MAG: type VI secretion system ATPase TssH, partial [Clostridia bacterium]|nr:type VI secretion system ATPase TssH [Clostridia bacterium]
MDIRKLTQRSREAVAAAQQLAQRNGNAEIDQEHLLLSLLSQEDSLIGSLFTRMGKEEAAIASAAKAAVERLARMSGSGYDPDRIYITKDLEKALNRAEEEAQHMKDDFVSVEHLFLGLLESPNKALKDIFRQ